jgi:hypothetical protein
MTCPRPLVDSWTACVSQTGLENKEGLNNPGEWSKAPTALTGSGKTVRLRSWVADVGLSDRVVVRPARRALLQQVTDVLVLHSLYSPATRDLPQPRILADGRARTPAQVPDALRGPTQGLFVARG